MLKPKDVVFAALSKSIEVDHDDFIKLLGTRADGPDRRGSYYPGKTKVEVLELLREAEWAVSTHPAIVAPARGFKAEVPGMFGMVHIDNIPEGTEIVWEDPHNGKEFSDGKQKVSAIASLPIELGAVGYTTMLIGPRSKEDDTLLVWSFFPGSPVAPPMVDRFLEQYDRHGAKVSKLQLKELGVEWVKMK